MNDISIANLNSAWLNIDLDDFTVFVGWNKGFNDKKYKDFKKKSKVVYTVLGTVSQSLEFKSLLGYVIVNDKGEIQLVKEDKLLDILKKYPCMNYSLMSNEGRFFVRKNPKAITKEYKNSEIKDLLGYSFDDFDLHVDMTLEQIDFCMKNNGFFLGFRKDFPTEYFGTIVNSSHLIYYNKEGTQFVLNYIDKKQGSLNYYHQDCILMRNVEHKRYVDYLKNCPYNSCSSSPLVDTRSADLDSNYTDMLFKGSNVHRFMDMSEKAKTYSKPILPYIVGPNMYALHSMLNITPYQDKKIKEYLSDEKSWNIKEFMSLYMGYLNILNYSDGLKDFYLNYFKELPKYFEEYGKIHNISDNKIKKMKKYIENLV